MVEDDNIIIVSISILSEYTVISILKRAMACIVYIYILLFVNNIISAF